MLIKRSAAVVFALSLLPMTALADTYPHCASIKEMATVASTTVSGRIVTIESADACGKPGHMIAITLKSKDSTEAQKLPRVFLAPNSYLMRHKMHFAIGDDVEILGISYTGPDEAPQMTALEVSKGSQKLQLRDSQGRPLWSGKQGAKSVAH